MPINNIIINYHGNKNDLRIVNYWYYNVRINTIFGSIVHQVFTQYFLSSDITSKHDFSGYPIAHPTKRTFWPIWVISTYAISSFVTFRAQYTITAYSIYDGTLRPNIRSITYVSPSQEELWFILEARTTIILRLQGAKQAHVFACKPIGLQSLKCWWYWAFSHLSFLMKDLKCHRLTCGDFISFKVLLPGV